MAAEQQDLDMIGILNEHNMITGGIVDDVLKDNEERLVDTINQSTKLYNSFIQQEVEK